MRTLFIVFATCSLFILLDGCKRRGCMENVECVENYESKAKKSGDCLGCMDLAAFNYCPEATEESVNCMYQREFYSDNAEFGWIDIWVSDSADNSTTANLLYEGRITNFPKIIPDCDQSDSTLTISRRPGEFYYEIETQTGNTEWGWVTYRAEGCRLLDVQ